MMDPTTYAEARKLLESARKQEDGKVHPHYRKARIFWEDDGKRTNIVVYIWNRTGNGYDKITAGERRRQDDASDRPWNRKLLTLYPNGTIRLHMVEQARYYHQGFYGNQYRVASIFLPYRIAGEGMAIHPKAGKKPVEPRLKEVRQPEYVPEDGYGWEERSKKKARARYEEHVAKYGSLEAWFEAWYTWRRARDKYEKKLKKWANDNRTPIFDGMLIDSDGVAQSARACDRNEARIRREKREEEKRRAETDRKYKAVMRKREAEAKKRREAEEKAQKIRAAEFTKAMKSPKSKAAFDAIIDPNVKEFLIQNGIAPDEEGFVTLYKFVQPGDSADRFFSGYDKTTVYEIGKTTVEPKKYIASATCGQGLHFGANVKDCDSWSGRSSGRSVYIACRVPIKDAVVVPHHGYTYAFDDKGNYLIDEHGGHKVVISNYDGAKIKARECFVLGVASMETGRVVTPRQREAERQKFVKALIKEYRPSYVHMPLESSDPYTPSLGKSYRDLFSRAVPKGMKKAEVLEALLLGLAEKKYPAPLAKGSK